jgi:3-oxoacyl-[acyl-carrier protein] reductase
MSLAGKVAVVTGAARGIGKAVATHLASEGATVVIADINAKAAGETAAELEAAGRTAMGCPLDVTNPAQVAAMVEAVLARYGRIDILVNNAGITRDALILRMKEEEWDQVLSVNLGGAFHCARAVLRPMLKQKQGGRIINIASVVGSMGNAGQANYVASKAGLIGLTKALAREVASRSITVNAVSPGFIETEMTAGLPDNAKQAYLSQIPLARFGTAAEVAAAVGFLASEGAGYITGQVIHVNGGMWSS